MIIKEDNKNFKNSTKCWISHNKYIDHDVKVRYHCHFREYRGSADRDCNIILKLNHKLIHNVKNHNSHLFMEQLGKLNLKI